MFNSILKIFARTAAIIAFVVGSAGFIVNVNAAPGNGQGQGQPGGGATETPDYGDLIILLRDADGVPIPSNPVPVEDPETGQTVPGGLCWQPKAFGVGTTSCPAECETSPGSGLVNVDQYYCSIADGCAGCVQEVDFGRVNEARSPVTVFESQLEDVLVNLATADCVTLDPAGRMVASRNTDGLVTSQTIDSPLQNLAIYRQLMLTGSIGVPLPQEAGVLDTAARGLGAASDKTGEVNVDMVAYVNMIMGLDMAPTILPKLTETFREEVQGEMVTVVKQYLDYGAHGYNRQDNFTLLPKPAYITDDSTPPVVMDGWFEYLIELTATPTFGIEYGPILDGVFPGLVNDENLANIGAFAQAADDTRAVINFMHTWPIPGEHATLLTCEASADITYDLSISDVSGLQVPTQMVDGGEGREFVITVSNAGPDAATGYVTVTAVPANGGTIEGSPWTFSFTDLVGGASESWAQFFSIALGERTTIDWTAAVYAAHDVNLGNNTATATTSVKVTGGGRGGGRP